MSLMTWIRTRSHTDAAVAEAVRGAMGAYPEEYGAAHRAKRELPDIMLAHSLMPDALRGVFSGYGAMLSPALPLSRRQHEMIAVVVSVINGCYY